MNDTLNHPARRELSLFWNVHLAWVLVRDHGTLPGQGRGGLRRAPAAGPRGGGGRRPRVTASGGGPADGTHPACDRQPLRRVGRRGPGNQPSAMEIAALRASRAEHCPLASAWAQGPAQCSPNSLSAFLLLSQMERALARMNAP